MTFNPILIWFLAGLALVLSEFLIPGIILVFFGAGAWIVTLTTWLGWTGGWSSQLLVFSISSVALLVFLRRRLRSRFFGYVGAESDPNRDLDEFVGQQVTVTVDIVPDGPDGKVEFKGADWGASAATPLAAGSRAVIEAVDGIRLRVRPE